jgi:hypothetical protein
VISSRTGDAPRLSTINWKFASIFVTTSTLRGTRGCKPVSKSLYLINPLADFPSYFSAEVFRAWGFAPATSMADLAIATVAALAPSDFEVRLCDENVSPVDFDVAADFIASPASSANGAA